MKKNNFPKISKTPVELWWLVGLPESGSPDAILHIASYELKLALNRIFRSLLFYN